MKTSLRHTLFAALLALGISSARSQTAYFTNTLGGDWNNAVNWDLAGVNVVPSAGQNANVGGFGAVTVDYNAPMAATTFGALDVNGGATLNVNAAGFTQDLTPSGAAMLTLNAATLNIGAGGVWTATNGSTSTIALGGALNVSGTAYLAPVPATPPLTISAGGILNVNTGGKMTIADGGATSVSGTIVLGGELTLSNSAALNLLTSSSTTVNGGALVLTNHTGGTVALGEGTGSDANAGAAFTNNAGTVIFGPQLVVRSRDTRFTMNGGFLDLRGGLNYAVSGNDGRQYIRINGGTANLNAVIINRAVLNQGGLLVQNGMVNSASIRIGTGVAAANSRMDGGVWTNAGLFAIGDRNNPATGARRTYFVMAGGDLVTQGSDGIIINNLGQTTLAAPTDDGGTLTMTGGTITTEGVYLNGPAVTANAYARFELSGGTMYLGTLGLIANTAGTDMTAVFTLTGGTLAAKADWASSANLPLTGPVTFKAADVSGTAHNITLNGVVSGSGALTKIGAGTLTLNSANTYSGVTTVNAGTLALGAAGNLANSIQVAVGSGSVFDVTAGGFTVGASKSLTGSGTALGNIAVASGGTINPGSNTVTGTLTISGALTETGGAVNHFELPNTPGPTNDRLVVGGDLNISGVNTLEVVGGGAPGTVHVLIQYGGAFNGALANFTLVGASGVLTNDTVNKTIGFIVTSSVRSPASVQWVGNASFNDWDVINRTNWLNGVALDYFVTGDQVFFGAAGVANPNVNIIGNVAPASTTVGAAGNYTFGGTGSIAGTGALIKTNTGTLTINTVNAYTGPTLISNGVVEVAAIANGSQNSSLGASDNSAANLVVNGGTLRYLGATVTTDRSATVGDNGATLSVASSAATLTVNGALAGNGKLTKTGDGVLVLGTANTYAGGSVVNAGTLQFNNASGAGAGGVTNNGATLRLNGQIVLNNTFEFNGNCNLQLSGVGGGNVCPRGSWSGSGYVTATFLTQNAAQVLTIGGQGNNGGHMWDFSGTVDFGANDGFLRINNDNSTFNFGSSNATFNAGTGTATLHQRNGATTTHFGALIGGPNTKLSGRGGTGTSGTTTYSIGGKNLDTEFAGQINNGSGTTAIIKVGTGKLTLSGASIHTGTTTVEAGTLQLDGSFTGSAITVVSSTGSTLAGNGGTDSALDVQFGTYLAPGNAGIGRLAAGSLNLGSGSTNLMEINKTAGTNDVVAATASITYSGTLVVNNLSGTLADGDVFRLFEAPEGAYFGAFEAIELPALVGPNLFWDTTQLTVDGTIRVYTPKPVITSFGMDGGNLYLAGNNGGNTSTHYIVLTSTNVAAPANLWTPVVTNTFAFDGSFGFTNAVNPATPARFFRVKTP